MEKMNSHVHGPVISSVLEQRSPLCCRASLMENTTSLEMCLHPLSAVAVSALLACLWCNENKENNPKETI